MLRKVFLVISMFLFFAAAMFAQGSPTSATTPPASEPTKKAPIFRPTKDQIKQVQAILKEKKLYNGEASGTYNDETRSGIKSFQKDNGLKETGTLNRATLEKFRVELTASQKLIPVSEASFASSSEARSAKPVKSSTDATPAKASVATTEASSRDEDKPKKAAPFRASPDQIKAAQKLLKQKSFYSGEETGNLDEATREGLKKFQDGSGIKVTGTLNALTLDKMGIPLTEKQKAAADAAATPKN